MSATASTLSDLRHGGALAPQVQQLPTVRADFFDLQGFELLQRVAKAFASSTLVPQQYQGNLANCMIALNLARRLRADELMVMQNLYIVHGNPGWSSKFLIASVNTCGRFSALRYEWRGQPGADDFGCRAWTIEKETGERLNGVWVDWKMVKAEGWNSKSGSKWKTMPEQMFVYRSAAFWVRAYAPEISMGLSTAEELADVVEVARDGTVTVTSEYLRTDMPAVPRNQALSSVPATAGAENGPGVAETASGDAQKSSPVPQAVTSAPPAFDADAFAEKMERAADAGDIDTMDAMADELRGLADQDLADTLTAQYRRLRASAEEMRDGQGSVLQAAPPAPAPAPAPAGRRTRASAGTTFGNLD